MFTVKIYRKRYDLERDDPHAACKTPMLGEESTEMLACHSLRFVHKYGDGGIENQAQWLKLYNKEGGVTQEIELRSATFCRGDGSPLFRDDVSKIIIENAAGKTTQVIPICDFQAQVV